MFECTLQENRLNAITYSLSLLISLGAHAATLCLVVLLPLMFFSALNQNELLTFLFAPPSTPVPAPPPTPPAIARVGAGRVVIRPDIYRVPSVIPEGIPAPDEAPAAIGIEQLAQIGGSLAVNGSGMEGALQHLIQKEPPELPVLQPPVKRVPVRVGGSLQESKCIFRVSPVYPDLARRTRTTGTVVLEATIDEEGNVSGLKILSGHPFLNEAALDAVRQWKYSPTVLNGEPMPVQALVTVIFSLR
jgi:periplasmic protein TonB